MNVIGIIAGDCNIAHILIKACMDIGTKSIIVKISSNKDEDFLQYNNLKIVQIGEVKKAIEFFRENEVKQIIFAGKINRPDNLFQIKVDSIGAKLLAKVTANKIFGDNNILAKVKEFFEEYGFEIRSVTDIVKDLVVAPGLISKKNPSGSDLANIKLGIDMINAISEFDVGQAVIVANQRVIAVEAAEGTDEMLERSLGLIKTDDACLIKIPKKNQIDEIDLPCVALNTVKLAFKAGIRGIAIKSYSTILLDRDLVIKFINDRDMYFLSLN